MVGNIYLSLLNILTASILYKTQQQNLLNLEKPIKENGKPQDKKKTEKKINTKKKCNNTKVHCCREAISELLQNLNKKKCKIKILLTTGSACCKLSGLIKDIRKKGKLILLIDPETSAQWYIPTDKIAAVFLNCPCT